MHIWETSLSFLAGAQHWHLLDVYSPWKFTRTYLMYGDLEGGGAIAKDCPGTQDEL